MLSRLQDIGIDTTKKEYSMPKGSHAFVDEEGNYTIHLPNKRKGGAPIPVKKVRLCERVSSPIQIAEYNKWVKPENNEHLLVYINNDNEIKYLCVSFFEEVNKKTRGVDGWKYPADLREVLLVLRINDMILWGLNATEARTVLQRGDYKEVSKYLYRVNAISGGEFELRHHSDARTDKNSRIRITPAALKKRGLPLKVELSIMGELSVVRR